jgi:hypothetical protein
MKKMMNVRIIDAHTGERHTEEYPIGNYFGPVDLGLHLSEKYHGLNFGIVQNAPTIRIAAIIYGGETLGEIP